MVDSPDNIVPITPDARLAAEKFSAEHNHELLTILFTDHVDSTKLQSDLGNVEWARNSCLAAATKSPYGKG